VGWGGVGWDGVGLGVLFPTLQVGVVRFLLLLLLLLLPPPSSHLYSLGYYIIAVTWIHGSSMDYGLSMDYPWNIHGLSTNNQWLLHG